MTTVPAARWFWFQFLMMRLCMSATYSGQQKSDTPSLTPPSPPAPPLDRPNPWPFAPVSTFAVPACVSNPRPAAVPLGSLDAAVGFGGVRGFCFGSGSVIFGGVGAREGGMFLAICGSLDGCAA